MSNNFLREFEQKPIPYYPIYRQLTGSTTAGILLSQIMHLFSSSPQKKISKTDNEIMEETKLSSKELRNAKLKLKQLSFLTISRAGIPAKTYYEIKWKTYKSELKRVCKDMGQTSIAQKTKLDAPKGVFAKVDLPFREQKKMDDYSLLKDQNEELERIYYQMQEMGFSYAIADVFNSLRERDKTLSTDELADALIFNWIANKHQYNSDDKFWIKQFYDDCISRYKKWMIGNLEEESVRPKWVKEKLEKDLGKDSKSKRNRLLRYKIFKSE
jgi:hypothetical protein